MGQLSRLLASALLMGPAKVPGLRLSSSSRAARLFCSLSFALVTLTLFRIETYRGISAGWQKVAIRSHQADAERLLALLQKVRPDFYSRVSAL